MKKMPPEAEFTLKEETLTKKLGSAQAPCGWWQIRTNRTNWDG